MVHKTISIICTVRLQCVNILCFKMDTNIISYFLIHRYKDGRPLVKDHSSSVLRNLDQRDSGFEDSLGETISHLSLDCVSENDAGYYECVAHNSNGQKTTVGTEVNVVSKLIFVLPCKLKNAKLLRMLLIYSKNLWTSWG